MIVRSALISAVLGGVCPADVRSGKAEAALLAASSTYEPGRPLQTAIRLTLDPGWHTYWGNPGEGGMKISVKWELPEGWQAGELEEPVPKRFKTGDLAGFGYEGTVVFPMKLIPGGEAKGDLKITGKVSWLTCNDAACVPGVADLELSFAPGAEAVTSEADLIAEALEKIPRAETAVFHLTVYEKPGVLVLALQPLEAGKPPLTSYEVFPRTPGVVDPKAKFEFHEEAGRWLAEVPKSEYAEEKVSELTLVLAGTSSQPPMAISWKATPSAAGKN